MKLKDIQSWALLPQFAEDAAYLQKAFDLIIKPNVERIKSLSQPLSIEAIHALTDDELQLLYDQYGVAEYYPDLDRSVRDMMLYNIVRYYRWLGTPKVMEILCKYIFNGFELEAIVWDNLAWDNGDLVHPELLDMYDVEVIPCGNVLPDNALYRILANIIRFSRNTQTLRDIWFTMPDNDIDVSACVGLSYGSCGVVNVENYTLCENVTPQIMRCYPQSVGSQGIRNVSIQRYSYITAYSDTGSLITPEYGFVVFAVYYLSGSDLLPYGSDVVDNFSFRYSGSLQINNANARTVEVAMVEYKSLPTQKAYISQYGRTYDSSFTYNTDTYLYGDDYNYIPYESSKKYILTCASKVDGTIINAHVNTVNMNGFLGYRISVTATACYFYYTIQNL